MCLLTDFFRFNKKDIPEIKEDIPIIPPAVLPITPVIELTDNKPLYSKYSQKDPRWGALKFSPLNISMANYGCLITSIAMILRIQPDEVLHKVKKCFNTQGLLVWAHAEKALIMKHTYHSKEARKTMALVIAETDNYKPKNPQHFFLWLGDNMIVDPLDYPAIKKPNKYNIVSIREIINVS